MRDTLLGALTIAIVGMYALMSMTMPSEAHPAIILLFFLLLYISVLIVLIFLLLGGSRLMGKFSTRVNLAKPITYGRAYMIASVLALAPVMVVAMNSVGGVSVREVLLIVLFETIALFYLWRRR